MQAWKAVVAVKQGILIGKFKGHELWLGGAQHVVVISPTRSGKTASVAKPVALSYEESMMSALVQPARRTAVA